MMASLTYRRREGTHLSPCSGEMTLRDKWGSKDRSHGVQSRSPAWRVPRSPQLPGSGTADVGGLLGSLRGAGGQATG